MKFGINTFLFAAPFTIESFTTDVKIIAKAASIWRKLEPSPENIAVKGLAFLKNQLS